MCDKYQLIVPTIEFEDEYFAYVNEFIARDEPSTFYRLPEGNFDEFIQQLAREARGEGMPDWCVPQHTFWCLRGEGHLTGVIKVRLHLTPALEEYGGHIGYFVRPSERGQGCATRMLALALEKARTFGLVRVLLMCVKANVASARVIEKNGGILASEGISPIDGGPVLRYWIEL